MNGRRLKLWLNLLAGGALMLAVWVLLVWVASRPALRTLIDLTPQRVNSVDPATEQLLRDLRAEGAEVEFHLFIPYRTGGAANELQQQYFAIRDRLADLTRTLLVRYQHLGGESVKVLDHDMYGDAASTREAVQAFDYKVEEGETLVVAVTMPKKERRFRKLSILAEMAHIEIPSVPGPGGKPSLPVLKDYLGEVAISSALKGLLVQGTPIARVLKDYSPDLDVTKGAGTSYGSLLEALHLSGFDVQEFSFRDQPTVPPDTAVMLVLEPRREFSERDADALFAYAQRGGRVLIDYTYAAAEGGLEWNPAGGRFGELLGYEIGPQPIFHLVPDPGGRSGQRGIDGVPGVATLQLSYALPLHPLTQRWAQNGRPMEVKAAREVRERTRPGGVTQHPLLVTGPDAWTARPGADGYPDLRAPRVGMRQFLMAMCCEVAAVDASGDATAQARSGEVVITSGMFCNNLGMQAGFGDFAVNVCNWLAERKVLMDIRGSRYQAHYLDLKEPQLRGIKSLLVYWVPGAFLGLGLLVWWRRRH